MSKILEKLGIYDLFVLLLTGTIVVAITGGIDQYVLEFGLSNMIAVEDTFSFLLISYFVGLVLHEVSSLIFSRFYFGKNCLLCRALNAKRDGEPSLTEYEKTRIRNQLSQIPELKDVMTNGTIEAWAVAYEYCKAGMKSASDISHNERDQSTAGISRSLMVYFAFLALVLVSYAIWEHTFKCWPYIAGSIFLVLILYHRFLRFTYLRYIRTFKSFINGSLTKDQDRASSLVNQKN